MSLRCSTPEGVFVGFTRSATRSQWDHRLLNARGRLRRVHTRRSQRIFEASTSAQRPRASSSGSRRTARSWRRRRWLLNARGRLRRVHARVVRTARAMRSCSTPEGVFVGFTRLPGRRGRAALAAQRPRASSSGSRVQRDVQVRQGRLLNARGRLRRVHILVTFPDLVNNNCSTPEGVFVGFTTRRSRCPCRGEPLLNARGRLRRVHVKTNTFISYEGGCSTPEGVFVGFTAVSRRLSHPSVRCSTPEGVFVGFTSARSSRSWPVVAAQRPRASSSGSRCCSTPGCRTGIAAQRPRASSSGSPVRCGPDRHQGIRLLNARGRLRRVHSYQSGSTTPLLAAQRPRASSSGSR